MTIEEKRRELFEEAARRDWDKACHDFCRLADGYQNDCTDVAWWAFNAALDAVVITLPSPYPSVFYGAEEFADGIEECRKFIKENNFLGLKMLP